MKETSPNIIEAGTFFVVSEGEYSDYDILLLCRALVDIDIESVRTEYLAMRPDEAREFSFSTVRFLVWLTTKEPRVCEEINYRELWLGAYGTSTPKVVPNRKLRTE